jgi:plastocyanin
MRKLIVALALIATAAIAAGAALAATNGSNDGRPVVIKALSGMKMVPNKYMQEEMRFAPGTVTVKSGDSITFEFGDKQMEPHTLTIVPKSLLARTAADVERCAACRYATPHLKNPKAMPGPGNPIVHWVLEKGLPGLDTVGDSVAIQPDGPHKSITVKVTAKPGTTLYFMCAPHPWMQGKIVVR